MDTQKKTTKLYGFFVVLCVTVMLACDTLAFETVSFKGIQLSASGIIFPLDFLMLSVVTNAYGYKASGKIIWYMLATQFLFIFLVNGITFLGKNTKNDIQIAYFLIYGSMWKLILSSSTAVLISYFSNDFFVSFSKVKTKLLEQNTIIRILASTSISQAILVFISYPINFYGIYSIHKIFSLAINTWVYKMICVFVLIPIISILVLLVKKIDHADAYDIGVNYNPFLVFK